MLNAAAGPGGVPHGRRHDCDGQRHPHSYRKSLGVTPIERFTTMPDHVHTLVRLAENTAGELAGGGAVSADRVSRCHAEVAGETDVVVSPKNAVPLREVFPLDLLPPSRTECPRSGNLPSPPLLPFPCLTEIPNAPWRGLPPTVKRRPRLPFSRPDSGGFSLRAKNGKT